MLKVEDKEYWEIEEELLAAQGLTPPPREREEKPKPVDKYYKVSSLVSMRNFS